MAPKLEFKEFIACFRKQFYFQTRKGGRFHSHYYTNCNKQQGLKNDQWAMMIFIHLGTLYGFSDIQIKEELKLRKSHYELLKEEVRKVYRPSYYDRKLHDKVVVKSGLVINAIYRNHGVVMEKIRIYY